MNILIDATAVAFGGIRTYAERLLEAWPDHDELHVATHPQAQLTLPEQSVRWDAGCDGLLATGAVYGLHLPRLQRRVRPDVLLALRPALPGLTTTPTVVVSHDFRHRARPHEFSRLGRTKRWMMYGDAVRRATRLIAISQRAADELVVYSTRGRGDIDVVHHGADHVLDWSSPSSAGIVDEPYALAFGHWSNKRVDLVVEGWAQYLARTTQPSVRRLRVLGVPDADRPPLIRSIERLGLGAQVTLCPFLPDDEHQAVVRASSLLLFPSNYEGFGLPALEFMALGIPVVISPDAALIEVTAGHASMMSAWTSEELARAAAAALAQGVIRLDKARSHARSFTWRQTALGTRAALEKARA